MKLDITKNAKRNIIFGLLNKVVTLLLPFLVRTITIKVLGAEYLGLSSLFSSILQVLNLSELGFGSAIVYSMYRPIAQNDSQTICALLNLYRKVYRVIGLIILITGLCLLPFLPKLIRGTCPDGVSIYLLYLIYLSNTVISYWLFAYKSSVLNAFQRVDVISCVNTVTQGLMSILQIIILLTVHNYYLFLLVIPLSNAINNLYISYSVKKLYPQYICKGEIAKPIQNEIKIKVTGLMINKLCQVSRNAFDSIFVSAFLGLTITAMYNNYYYVINALISGISVLTSSLLAGIGNNLELESKEKNYSDMRKLNFIYMIISGWCTVCILCLYQPFMKIWVGDKLTFPFSIAVLFSIYFYILKMGDIRGLYSDAAGLWWENRYRAVAESIMNIVLNYVLVQVWGVTGIIIATLISLLVINFGYGSQIIFQHYFKNGMLKKYFWDHARYAGVTLVISLATYWVCEQIHGGDWFVLIFRMVICCILPIVMYFVIYCSTKDYKLSMQWLLSKIKMKS